MDPETTSTSEIKLVMSVYFYIEWQTTLHPLPTTVVPSETNSKVSDQLLLPPHATTPSSPCNYSTSSVGSGVLFPVPPDCKFSGGTADLPPRTRLRSPSTSFQFIQRFLLSSSSED